MIGAAPTINATRYDADSPTIEIVLSRGWQAINLKGLWHFRELLYFLVWRDVKIRYKQTVLGVAWALLQAETPSADERLRRQAESR